jgi:hypothetical protein
LISMISDYYYLCYLHSIYNQNLKNFNLLGYWPHIVPSEQKSHNKFHNLLKKVVHYLIKRKWTILYSSLGIKKIIDPNNLDSNYLNLNRQQNNRAKKIFTNLKEKKDILKIYVKGLYIGDLVYDTYIRFRNEPTVDINDKFLLKIITKSIIFKDIFKKISKKIDFFYTPFSSYINHGLPARVFLKNKVKVITDGNYQYNKKLSLNDYNHVENYKNYRKDFKKIENKTKAIGLSKKFINNYFFNSNKKSIYTYMKKNLFSKKSKSIFKNLDGVIFLPNFYETQREWGEIAFNDFYEWIFFTLNLIEKHKLRIALKPHPNINTINKESIAVINQIKHKYPNIRWLDADESNAKIFNSINFGISTWGSVLWELAYFKKIAICMGSHPGKFYNFSYDAKNKKEYEKLIINANKLKNKNYSLKDIYEYIYMYMLRENDNFTTTARELKLKQIDFSTSGGIQYYLNKLYRHEFAKKKSQ